MSVRYRFITTWETEPDRVMILSDQEDHIVQAAIEHRMAASGESPKTALLSVLEWYAAESRPRFAVDDLGAALSVICQHYLDVTATKQ